MMKNEINEKEPLLVTIVSGSAGSFLTETTLVYQTPKKIVDYVEKHEYDYLIQNPPYGVRR
jgi:hypothetical protein